LQSTAWAGASGAGGSVSSSSPTQYVGVEIERVAERRDGFAYCQRDENTRMLRRSGRAVVRLAQLVRVQPWSLIADKTCTTTTTGPRIRDDLDYYLRVRDIDNEGVPVLSCIGVSPDQRQKGHIRVYEVREVLRQVLRVHNERHVHKRVVVSGGECSRELVVVVCLHLVHRYGAERSGSKIHEVGEHQAGLDSTLWRRVNERAVVIPAEIRSTNCSTRPGTVALTSVRTSAIDHWQVIDRPVERTVWIAASHCVLADATVGVLVDDERRRE